MQAVSPRNLPPAMMDTFPERHYTLAEVASMWSISHEKARRLFQNESGVIRSRQRASYGRRRYSTYRIPGQRGRVEGNPSLEVGFQAGTVGLSASVASDLSGVYGYCRGKLSTDSALNILHAQLELRTHLFCGKIRSCCHQSPGAKSGSFSRSCLRPTRASPWLGGLRFC